MVSASIMMLGSCISTISRFDVAYEEAMEELESWISQSLRAIQPMANNDMPAEISCRQENFEADDYDRKGAVAITYCEVRNMQKAWASSPTM